MEESRAEGVGDALGASLKNANGCGGCLAAIVIILGLGMALSGSENETTSRFVGNNRGSDGRIVPQYREFATGRTIYHSGEIAGGVALMMLGLGFVAWAKLKESEGQRMVLKNLDDAEANALRSIRAELDKSHPSLKLLMSDWLDRDAAPPEEVAVYVLEQRVQNRLNANARKQTYRFCGLAAEALQEGKRHQSELEALQEAGYLEERFANDSAGWPTCHVCVSMGWDSGDSVRTRLDPDR